MTDSGRMISAVDAYVDGFERGDAAAIAALFAENATVEDPIGAPPHVGRTAIRAFYETSMASGAKLVLTGPVRTAANTAAFAFEVRLELQGKPLRIDVIDMFEFDADGLIHAMRACWGEGNMHVGDAL